MCLSPLTCQCPPGAYERGNDFLKRVIEPAVLEVNGLSEFGIKVAVERAYSRAPITAVSLGLWRKTENEYRETYRERQRSKLGRMARLKGAIDMRRSLRAPASLCPPSKDEQAVRSMIKARLLQPATASSVSRPPAVRRA